MHFRTCTPKVHNLNSIGCQTSCDFVTAGCPWSASNFQGLPSMSLLHIFLSSKRSFQSWSTLFSDHTWASCPGNCPFLSLASLCQWPMLFPDTDFTFPFLTQVICPYLYYWVCPKPILGLLFLLTSLNSSKNNLEIILCVFYFQLCT